jgi:hypothetical protein
MEPIHGTFYFQLTTDGNLIGEYKNQFTPRQRPECAFRRDGALADEYQTFVGEYISTWYEPEQNSAVRARLSVQPRGEPSRNQFVLTWSNFRGTRLYWGEAMLNDGQLVGNYWSA